VSDSLHERAEVLVELYFRQVDAERIAAMRAGAAKSAASASLQAKLGLDAASSDALVAIGLSFEAMAAYALIPLLHVAWSDTSLSPVECDAVRAQASALGILADSAGGVALEAWLTREPQPALFEAWKLAHRSMAPELRRDLDGKVLAGARAVARAAGGLGPFGAISGAERTALAELESLLGG
jgi:hypothetical protein